MIGRKEGEQGKEKEGETRDKGTGPNGLGHTLKLGILTTGQVEYRAVQCGRIDRETAAAVSKGDRSCDQRNGGVLRKDSDNLMNGDGGRSSRKVVSCRMRTE
jgi:hypothetical protein